MEIDINKINEIAVDAGAEIIKVYLSGDFDASAKKDNSPLTLADKKSHSLITNRLRQLYPAIPVISEEGYLTEYEERKKWKYFWLVDPLDGTKEFIKKNGEFTVNIALIEENTPIAGVIYIPVTETLYYADNSGAFKYYDNQTQQLFVNDQIENLTVAKSRSHSSKEEESFYSQFNVKNTISAGSSLKFCLIAEGKASLYYRNGPTWEWDTAAGHALVKYAGGFMLDNKLGDFIYNKNTLLNNAFCASSFKVPIEHLKTVYEKNHF